MSRRLLVALTILVALTAAAVLPVEADPSIGPTAGPGSGTTEAVGEAGTQARTYTYSLATRGRIRVDMDYVAIHVAQTLNDPRGWSLGGAIEFRQVASGGDFTLWMSEASMVPSFGSPCSSSWSCRVGRNVIINQTRWMGASDSWLAGGGTLDGYRHYVVNHETGHWLGFGHQNCPGAGQPAPVMQQQSKDLQGCRHNTWPIAAERASAAGRHRVVGRTAGVADQRIDFGAIGDQPIVCDWNGDGREGLGLVHGNRWRLRNRLDSGPPQNSFTYGQVGDRIVCGDWDGNGTETIGVVRGNLWLLANSNRSTFPALQFRFGAPDHTPVVGDWNGDGIDTPGMVQGNVWRIRNRNSTGTPFRTFTFGHNGDQPAVGDWDGNGRSDPGMVRGRTFRLRRSATGGSADHVVTFGRADVPAVVGRWVGVANDLPGRVLNGNWNLRRFAPVP